MFNVILTQIHTFFVLLCLYGVVPIIAFFYVIAFGSYLFDHYENFTVNSDHDHDNQCGDGDEDEDYCIDDENHECYADYSCCDK